MPQVLHTPPLAALIVSVLLTGPSGSAIGAEHGGEIAGWNQDQKFAYTLGWEMGQKLKRQGLALDSDLFAKAIGDALSERQPRLNAEQRQATMDRQQAIELRLLNDKAKKNQTIGADYLARNAQNPDVKALASGVQYEILKAGDGRQPTAKDKVSVHYHGTKINGTVFDSSVQRGQPARFKVSEVVPGFSQALQNMRAGGKWRVTIPAALAYGARGAGKSIGPNETLIFEIELLAIQ